MQDLSFQEAMDSTQVSDFIFTLKVKENCIYFI